MKIKIEADLNMNLKEILELIIHIIIQPDTVNLIELCSPEEPLEMRKHEGSIVITKL